MALPSVDCSDNTDGYVSGEQPFYETPADKAYMIIRAKYDGGADTYYKVAFKNKTSDGTLESIALLRNHHYLVKVTDRAGSNRQSAREQTVCSGG